MNNTFSFGMKQTTKNAVMRLKMMLQELIWHKSAISLRYFHVCDGSLVPDIMHDVLEGLLQYEVKLMLQYMINVESYFTLDMFNSKLENLDLGKAESNNRPTSISPKTISSEGNSLKQNGMSHYYLCTFTYLYVCYIQLHRCGFWDIYCHLLLKNIYLRMMNTGYCLCS